MSLPSVEGTGLETWFRRCQMDTMKKSRTRKPLRPYRALREDPRYDEIKKMIEEFPKEHMPKLKQYIQRWLSAS